MSRFFLLLLVIFGFAGQSAWAETAPVATNDTLVYKVFVRGNDAIGTFQAPTLESVRMENVGQYQTYRPSESTTVRMFDPRTLAATSPMPGSAAIGFAIWTNKPTNAELVPGTTWKVKFSRTPIGSGCLSSISADLTITITSIGTSAVIINGQSVEIKTVTATKNGWWSSNGCGNGKVTGDVIYSPELNVAISVDSTSYIKNFASGEKVVLSEIKRGAK